MAVALLVGCASAPVAPFEQGTERYRFEVSVTKGDEPGAFWCMGLVVDERARRSLLVPRFAVKPGETATASAPDVETGAVLEVNVTVAADGRSAEYQASLHRGAMLIASRTDRTNVR